MMTKKDYIKFADMIAKMEVEFYEYMDESRFDAGYTMATKHIKERMIQLFKSDNPNFDENRFNQYIENKVKSLLK